MISVITPTVRVEGLRVIRDCLDKQTYKDFEWIVVAPKELHDKVDVPCDLLLSDPPKNEGDFWSLCKAWNLAYSKAKGELIVNIQDWVWFKPSMLERFWGHYQDNPKSLVTAVGDHYERLEDGIPAELVWNDPRKRQDMGTFYRVDHTEMEMTVCSVPKQAVLDCGGVDEEYDKGPGVQEKEMCLRLEVLGYGMFIDQGLEYKAIRHPRLTTDWDEKYWSVTAKLYEKHVKELLAVKRPLNVGFVK